MRPETNWPQQAGILSNDLQFRAFVGERMGFDAENVYPSVAAEYLRRFCRIESRRDLATSLEARIKFRILRTEFDAWRRRIATHR